jgi:hypothetical protein
MDHARMVRDFVSVRLDAWWSHFPLHFVGRGCASAKSEDSFIVPG